MATPEEVVTAFIREWDVEHPDVDTLASYFTDDAVYHNMPMDPSEGIEAVREALAGVAGLTSRGWEIVYQAVDGDVVLNERIDRFHMRGKEVAGQGLRRLRAARRQDRALARLFRRCRLPGSASRLAVAQASIPLRNSAI